MPTDPEGNPADLIGPNAAAELLGVARSTLHNWRGDPDGPPFYRRPNGRAKYSKAELVEWQRTRRVAAT